MQFTVHIKKGKIASHLTIKQNIHREIGVNRSSWTVKYMIYSIYRTLHYFLNKRLSFGLSVDTNSYVAFPMMTQRLSENSPSEIGVLRPAAKTITLSLLEDFAQLFLKKFVDPWPSKGSAMLVDKTETSRTVSI